MKSVFISIAIAVGALTANATVSFNWLSGSGSVVLEDNSLAPRTWLAQVIWSADNVISPPSSADGLVPAVGDEVLFSNRINGNTGSTVNGRIQSQGQRDVGDQYAGGYLYTRVFDIDFGSSATPTRYGTSLTISGPLLIDDGIGTPETLTHNAGVAAGSLVVRAVPEPSTYAFFGIGALVFARRLRKR